ncbi:hypothetical protein OM363_00290 [Escherichia albertii]|uniref:hypothetical protein n=1 Tax=Escherichia albertii TaxID=208962 RepID=UPI00049506E8|nr:hypothetical protein [Escherichia albertii]EFX6077056.1 hypothetical protein [Shigella boydii]MCZ8623103.1 hypothetical protein [Escherichia albertii]MCZ8764026.1 hypothetical protein [Escherichia albertii]MCZ8868584.1 hypothetical protein [Escherichia albertii]MCZ8890289.1 hypothetical protein [Escherichia albertii]
MVTRSWLLIAALPLSISPSWGADFYYRQQEKGTVYVAEQKGEKDEILSELPDVNFSRLWRIANLANKQDCRLLSDFNPDKFDCDGEGDCQHTWLTDGRSVLWAGKVLKNPSGKPNVDAASFQAFGAFAADKRSIYFDGQRTDDNSGDKQVDMSSLAETEIWNLLRDKNSLWHKGRWLGHADGFQILRHDSALQFVVLTDSQVIVNGTSLPADSKTFQIIRWMPGELLVYRDKSGEHDYELKDIGHSCASFKIGLQNVSWLKQEATPAGSDCVYETLAGVDPEYFYLFVRNTGLYKNKIYKVTTNALGEGALINLKPEDLSDSLEAGGGWSLTNTYISTDGQLYAQQPTEIRKMHAKQGEWLRYNLGVGGWSSVKQPPSGLKPLFK